MSLATPHGLKIRFDEECLENVISPMKRAIDFSDLLMDVELWELLPVAMGKVVAITTAFITGNWIFTLVGGIIGLVIGGVLREITYSDIIRRLFPLFLGSGPVTIVAAIACSIYLGLRNEYLTIVVLISFFFPIAQMETIITSIFLAPLIYLMGRHSTKIMGMPLTHVERTFVSVCNNASRKVGIELDWGLYSGGGEEQNFASQILKEAQDTLDEAANRFQTEAFRMVGQVIEKAVAAKPDALVRVIKENPGRGPREWIYSQIGNIAGDMLESGHYHIYRGVLNPMGPGEDLLKMFDATFDELILIKAIDVDYANEQKAVIRMKIKSMG
jgi:hypothetical protein